MSIDSHTQQPETPHRDAQGRFAAGNKGGPGNPFARRVAGLRQAFFDAVSPEDLTSIVTAMVKEAKAGNVHAAKLVLSYLLGKPAPAADPDRLDADEWERYHETAKMITEVPYLMSREAPDLPLEMIRTARPAITAGMAQTLGSLLAAAEPKPVKSKERTTVAKEKADRIIPGRPSTNGRSTNGQSKKGKPANRPSANGKTADPLLALLAERQSYVATDGG